MQPLARDGLTSAQVTTILRDAPGLVAQRGLELLDLASLDLLEDISDGFRGGTVGRNTQQTIHGSCQLTVARDINPGSVLLRPYMTLTGSGMSARFNGGVYVPNTPQIDYGETPRVNQVTGADRLAQLQRPIGDAWVAEKGSTYQYEILRLFTAAGIDSSQVLFDGTAATTTLPADVPFPLLVDTSGSNVLPVDAVADSNSATSFLRAINTLLAGLGYKGVWVDWDGYFRCTKWVDSTLRTVEFSLDYDDPLKSIIALPRSKSRDISTTPNRWIGVRTNLVDGSGNPLTPSDGAGQYTYSNTDAGDSAINARGGDPLGVYATVLSLDAADQATLQQLVMKQAATDMQVVTTFAASSSPFPAAWHEDIYLYSDREAFGGAVKVISNGWTLDYGDSENPPALMKHTLQLVA